MPKLNLKIGKRILIKKQYLDLNGNCRKCGLDWSYQRMDANDGKIIILKEENLCTPTKIYYNGCMYCEDWLEEVPLNIKELNKYYEKLNKN